MKGIAVIIVTHNSADVILGCLDSCLPHATEVIVVDNASSDDTVSNVRRRPAAKLLANSENLGFAGGVNQAIAATAQPFILLLNPDARLNNGLGALCRACLIPGVGASAGKLLNEDGTFQQGFSVRRLPTAATLILETLGLNRLWRSNPVNRRYRCLDYDLSAPCDVEQPAGAFLMLRRDVWQQLGGFDLRFHPLWFEDVDFCKRLKDAGFKVRFEPSCSATHIGGHSASRLTPSHKALYWYGSLLEYAGKHFARQAARAVSAAVIVGAGLRLMMGIFSTRSRRVLPVYGGVIRMAFRFLSNPTAGGESSSSTCRKIIDQAQIHVP